MDPVDFRNATWADIQGKLEGNRARVYQDLFQRGPATTRELAARLGMDILTVRPRVTELCQLGLAKCADEEAGREGHYAAVPLHLAKAEFEAMQKNKFYQPEFKL